MLLDLSAATAPYALPVPDMPSSVWNDPDTLRSQFSRKAPEFFECESVLAVTGVEGGISALARLFQTWYGSMRVVLGEPSFNQWDVRFRRASHIVLDWPVDLILEGEIPECDVVVVGRPVDPSGEILSIDAAKELAQRLRAQGGWLILDEAYIDFTACDSFSSFLEEAPAIVLRSIGPFAGLKGSNLAFVCANRKVCQALMQELGTQAVSAPQWWLGLKYFEQELWREGQSNRVRLGLSRLREIWTPALGRLSQASNGVEIRESGCCLCVVIQNAVDLAAKLEDEGVLVKTYQSESFNAIRCAIPVSEEGWGKLKQALGNLADRS